MTYSADPFKSIEDMYRKFDLVQRPLTEEVLDYRMGLVTEEYVETMDAHRDGNPEGVVDGHVDMIVVLLGNLSIMGVNARDAFTAVMEANMAKEKGKRSPTDPDGSSILKPEGWVPPDHSDNHGLLGVIYEQRTTEITGTSEDC